MSLTTQQVIDVFATYPEDEPDWREKYAELFKHDEFVALLKTWNEHGTRITPLTALFTRLINVSEIVEYVVKCASQYPGLLTELINAKTQNGHTFLNNIGSFCEENLELAAELGHELITENYVISNHVYKRWWSVKAIIQTAENHGTPMPVIQTQLLLQNCADWVPEAVVDFSNYMRKHEELARPMCEIVSNAYDACGENAAFAMAMLLGIPSQYCGSIERQRALHIMNTWMNNQAKK